MNDILQTMMTIIGIALVYGIVGHQLEKRYNISPANWALYGYIFGFVMALVVMT